MSVVSWIVKRPACLQIAAAAIVLSPLAGVSMERRSARNEATARVAALSAGTGICLSVPPIGGVAPGPGGGSTRLLGSTTLASWQTVGGCGAGASTGSAAGVKWIGRSVTGGLVNVQCQLTYTRLAQDAERPEHHGFANVLITQPVGDRWTFGANVPLVLKYMHDPYETGADLSNTGLGDISLLLTRKLGPIGATALTLTAGLPTGEHDGRYRMRILNQSQQRGFGKPTGSITLDHTGDEIWGLTVVGGTAAWRGGQNDIDNYRAPTASLYGYLGYFLGPLVPAMGLSLTGATGHDRDQTVPQITGLYSAAANLSLEWSTDWIALLAGASFPYQYDGTPRDTEGRPRNPWGWGPWVVGLGVSLSPL